MVKGEKRNKSPVALETATKRSKAKKNLNFHCNCCASSTKSNLFSRRKHSLSVSLFFELFSKFLFFVFGNVVLKKTNCFYVFSCSTDNCKTFFMFIRVLLSSTKRNCCKFTLNSQNDLLLLVRSRQQEIFRNARSQDVFSLLFWHFKRNHVRVAKEQEEKLRVTGFVGLNCFCFSRSRGAKLPGKFEGLYRDFTGFWIWSVLGNSVWSFLDVSNLLLLRCFGSSKFYLIFFQW